MYIFDKKTLSFKKVSNLKIILIGISIVLLTNLLTFRITKTNYQCVSDNSLENILSNYKYYKTEIDSIFDDYENRVNIYLTKFPKTPINAQMLRLAAYNAWDSTGILLPLELALSQAQIESGMGFYGRSPKNNPYNIGEWDGKTVKWFDNTFDGVQSYYYTMCLNYLSCKGVEELLEDMKNCQGYSYASCEEYPQKIKDQYLYIAQYIENRI